jgi:hypothetical protein
MCRIILKLLRVPVLVTMTYTIIHLFYRKLYSGLYQLVHDISYVLMLQKISGTED